MTSEVNIGHIFFHALNVFSTLLSLFWMYMIVAKSPKEMNQYKWTIFKLALSDELFSLFLGFFLFPNMCFPAHGAAVLGLFASFGEQGGKLAVSLAGTLVSGQSIFTSINDCLYVRSLIIHGKTRVLEFLFDTWWIGIFVTLAGNALLSSIMITAMYFAFEDNETFIERTKNDGLYEYIEKYHLQGVPFLSLDMSTLNSKIFLGVLCLGLSSMYLANLIAALFLLWTLNSMKTGMSDKTFRAHRSMIYMLLAQNMYPVLSIILPVVVAVFAFLTPYRFLIRNEFFEPIAGTLLMAYPLISFCCCIAFLKPYRTYLKSFIPKRFRRVGIVDTQEPTFSSTQPNMVQVHVDH